MHSRNKVYNGVLQVGLTAAVDDFVKREADVGVINISFDLELTEGLFNVIQRVRLRNSSYCLIYFEQFVASRP